MVCGVCVCICVWFVCVCLCVWCVCVCGVCVCVYVCVCVCVWFVCVCMWLCVCVCVCVCVSLALGIGLVKRMCLIVIYGLSGCTSPLPDKRHDFREKFSNMKCVFGFSVQLVGNISHPMKYSDRYCHKCTSVFL